MPEPMTKRQWSQAITNLHSQREKEIEAVTAGIREKYEHLIDFASREWASAPLVAPVKIGDDPHPLQKKQIR